ncbi:MAG: heavy-metal-associated domain-containing protein [Bacillota bacterium]
MELTVYVKEATKENPIQTLEAILIKMDGIERALVDMQDGEVKIAYNDQQVSPEQIKNRIKQHGLHLH